MTDIEWGPEIRVDGKRPEWLGDDDQQIAYTRGAGWYGYTMSFFVRDAGNAYPGWVSVKTIRLPANHAYYLGLPPTTPEHDPALWDRMEALVRDMGETYHKAATPAVLPPRNYDMRHYQEARNIQNLLPKPVDPDLVEARNLAGDALAAYTNGSQTYATGIINAVRTGNDDAHPAVVAALAAIKRGRALQRGEA